LIIPVQANSQEEFRQLPERRSGVGRYAGFSLSAYGTPRWSANESVLGMHVFLDTYAPKEVDSYYVSVFVQKKNNGEWNDVAVMRGPRGEPYQSGLWGTARDWAHVKGTSGRVNWFIPHQVLSLPSGHVELRFQARFFKSNNEHLQDLDAVVAECPVIVSTRQGRRTIEYGVGGGIVEMPVEIFDVRKSKFIQVEEAPDERPPAPIPKPN
jgi:hypothetical protein